jgi:hypothetical protein
MRAIGRLARRLTPGAAAVVAAALIAVLAGCGAPAHRARGTAGGGVVSLTRIGTLRSAFNRDAGHPRLVLIFSPT